MTEYPTFPNPPITEALLDIRVELPSGMVYSDLEKFHECEDFKERFPEKKQQQSIEGGIKFSAKGEVEGLPASGKYVGYVFISSTRDKIVQAKLNGFTFNKLKPYKNWNELVNESRELWDIYLKIAKPTKITRIALRYINRIELPIPFDFKDYILTTPEIAPNLPQTLTNFLMRLEIPHPNAPITAIINQTMQPLTNNQTLPLIFDIDVYQKTSYTDNTDEIWNNFEELRTFKNDIFHRSITEKTKELFK